MVALQIRDVPDDVREVLAVRAAARGQSLQVYLLDLVTEDALRARNVEIFMRVGHLGGGSRVTPEEVADELAGLRAERDRQLGE